MSAAVSRAETSYHSPFFSVVSVRRVRVQARERQKVMRKWPPRKPKNMSSVTKRRTKTTTNNFFLIIPLYYQCCVCILLLRIKFFVGE